MKTESSWRYEPMIEAKAGDFTVPFMPSTAALRDLWGVFSHLLVWDLSRVAATGVSKASRSKSQHYLLDQNERKLDFRFTLNLNWWHDHNRPPCPESSVLSSYDFYDIKCLLSTLHSDTSASNDFRSKCEVLPIYSFFLTYSEGKSFFLVIYCRTNKECCFLSFFGNLLHNQELNNHDWTRLH